MIAFAQDSKTPSISLSGEALKAGCIARCEKRNARRLQARKR